MDIEFVPEGLAFIINKFVQDRPLKMRGINIDVFISKKSFQEIAIETRIAKEKSDFWVVRTIHSDGNRRLGDAVIHYLTYDSQFFPHGVKYRDNDSFIIECGRNAFCFISNFRREHHRKVAKKLIGEYILEPQGHS